MDADPKAYASFFPIAQRHEVKILPLLQAEIARKATIPDADEDAEIAKDRLAERQARAAATLVRMGKTEEVLPLLRHSADPRLRSYIINWLNPLGADPKFFASTLEHIDLNIKPPHIDPTKEMDAILFHPETSIRRALILAIGTYGTEGLSSGEREPLTTKLLDLYRNDPDSGVHGAAAWTLRQWKQQAKLQAADAELMKRKDLADRRWFVNSQGQTFAVIEGPVEFQMGSPSSEPERVAKENLHRLRIPRRFAIADREVTVEQYQRFLKENPQFGVDLTNVARFSPDVAGPIIDVSWYGASAYCNWLSRKEGLVECYEPNGQGEYNEGMRIKADVLNTPSYRLPTEAEWEYACRAGARTSRYYGVSIDLLAKYAWFGVNSRDHTWPGGSLLPNDLGLSDMLGNVWEWCQDPYLEYAKGTNATTNDDTIVNPKLTLTIYRVIRGGQYMDRPEFARSAMRLGNAPPYRNFNNGFRLAMTYR